MKIIIPISKALFFGMLLNFCACTEALKEKPDSEKLSSFFSSADRLQLGVNAIYDELTNGSLGEFPHFYNRFVFECITGLQIGWEKGPLRYNQGNISSADEYIDPYWTQCYRSINRANLMIEVSKTLNEPDKAALIKRLVAEAQFLRAFYYLELVKYFDHVPLKTAATKTYDEHASNAGGKAKVLEQIYADCNASFDVLPSDYTGSDVGRATKWAAKTLLMKAQLWGEKWAEAKITADYIMANSGIRLFDDFSDNFDINKENMGERIFEGQVNGVANSNEYTGHSGHFNPEDYPSELNGSGWSWLSATKEFRMSYAANDKRIAATFIESYRTGRVEKPDDEQYPIVHWSADADYNVSRFGGLVNEKADRKDPAQMIFGKAWCGKLTELGTPVWSATQKNIIYMRYADVLLGHSEACNESGTDDPYYGINEVRRRAGLSQLEGLTKATLRDAIVEERIHEFFWEQELYPELRRKSKFNGTPDYLGDQIKTYARISGNARAPKAKDYVLPIPLRELQGNPKVTQNDVWK